MIPEHCLNIFLDGEHSKCVKYLTKYENMTKEEAEREYREYRNKLMKSDRFCWECARKERNKSIGYYVIPNETKYCSDEEIVEMYESGMSYADITWETGKGGEEIKGILKSLSPLHSG